MSDAPPHPPPPTYDDDNDDDDVVVVDGTEETTEEEEDGDDDDAAGDVELGDGTDVEDPNWTTQPPHSTSASASSGGSTAMAWYRRMSTKYAAVFEDSTDGMRTSTCPTSHRCSAYRWTWSCAGTTITVRTGGDTIRTREGQRNCTICTTPSRRVRGRCARMGRRRDQRNRDDITMLMFIIFHLGHFARLNIIFTPIEVSSSLTL